MFGRLRRKLELIPAIRAIRLQFIEQVLLDMRGDISHAEARFLLGLVQDLDSDRPIIEIGTLFGFSTSVLLLGRKQNQLVITVDDFSWNPYGLPPSAHERITRHRLRGSIADGSLQIVRSAKDRFFANYDMGPPGLVFLDADHSYEATREDILWARSAGATIIAGHDYSPGSFDGVVRAVDEHGGPAELCESLFVLK
jgi:predicted O-methyltransferase YrrM